MAFSNYYSIGAAPPSDYRSRAMKAFADSGQSIGIAVYPRENVTIPDDVAKAIESFSSKIKTGMATRDDVDVLYGLLGDHQDLFHYVAAFDKNDSIYPEPANEFGVTGPSSGEILVKASSPKKSGSNSIVIIASGLGIGLVAMIAIAKHK